MTINMERKNCMKNRKKWLAALLLLALALPGAGVAEEELAMSDVENMTAPGVLPIVTEPVTITIAIESNSTVTDYEDNAWTRWLEEQTGIDIEIVLLPTENPAQKVELMIAANEELPDIVCVRTISPANLYAYYQDGIILPLDEMREKYAYYLNQEIETYFPNGEFEKVERLCRTYDGAQILWPATYNDPSNNYNPGFTLHLRDDWLEDTGMELPTTTEELYDVLVAFRDRDPNGNGVADEIPLLGGTRTLINSFIYYAPFNGMVLNVKDGKIYTPATEEAYREALRYQNRLVSEGLMSTQSFTADAAQIRAMLNPEDAQSAVVGAFGDRHPTSDLNDAATRNAYSPAWPITGPEGVCYAIYTPILQDQVTFITKYCDTPEIAVRLLDYFSEEETMIRSRWGVKDEDWYYVEDATGMTPRYADLGYGITYDTINNPYASSNNLIWKVDWITHLPPALLGARPIATYDDPDEAGYNQKFLTVLSDKWGKEDDEVVETILYTEEEELAIAEIKASLWSYIQECQTRFIMGEMSLDTDWDNYLATLDSIGLQEYLEVTQTAYDRMNAG